MSSNTTENNSTIEQRESLPIDNNQQQQQQQQQQQEEEEEKETTSTTNIDKETKEKHAEEQRLLLSSNVTTMFERITNLIQGEMQAGFNELKLLKNMNDHVAKRYEGMARRSEAIASQIAEMKEQYEKLAPFFKQIDEIDANVTELANIVQYLDKQTKNLELQLKPFL
jgi:chromosome segregation ATPase